MSSLVCTLRPLLQSAVHPITPSGWTQETDSYTVHVTPVDLHSTTTKHKLAMLGAGRLVGAAAGALGLGIASFLGLNQKFHLFVNRQPQQVEAEERSPTTPYP